MIFKAGSGHPGGSLSIVDILTVLYFNSMNHATKDSSERDRLILSKGHAAPALYATLSRAGYFPREELMSLREIGSAFQGHPDRRFFPYVEVSSGSLGMGLGIACGLALSLRIDKSNSKVYVIVGDGEIQEGIVWESAMFASKYNLGNLIVFLDHNNLQIDGKVQDIMPLEPLVSKWEAFNWHVQEIDGHDFNQIIKAIDVAKEERNRPSIIIARTIKGKGISFMENVVGFHGRAPTEEELKIALKELEDE